MAHLCEMDKTGRVQIYIDGCVLNHGSSNAKAGIGVWFAKEHPWNVAEPIRGEKDNNVTEFKAAIKALKIAYDQRLLKIRILTDSEIVKNVGARSMMDDKAVAKDLITSVKGYEGIGGDVQFQLVKGHEANGGNYEADKLAHLGAEKN